MILRYAKYFIESEDHGLGLFSAVVEFIAWRVGKKQQHLLEYDGETVDMGIEGICRISAFH